MYAYGRRVLIQNYATQQIIYYWPLSSKNLAKAPCPSLLRAVNNHVMPQVQLQSLVTLNLLIYFNPGPTELF